MIVYVFKEDGRGINIKTIRKFVHFKGEDPRILKTTQNLKKQTTNKKYILLKSM
jgi:hypothetical protein